MSESRTKNAERNIAFGLINRVATLVLPFISRTIILYLLGVAYVGVGTLFTSVLSFLSLAELGVGPAVVYSMYKPIAEKDYELVGALLGYYRRLYRWIGTAILAVGLVILPLIPVLTHQEAPEGVDIYILYCIYLANSVISYFFAGYRQSLLSAHQRTDVISRIATVIVFFVRVAEVLVLVLTRNFYCYAIVPVVGTLLTNTVTAVVTTKMYPQVIPGGTVPEDIRGDIRKKLVGLFGTKMTTTVVHQADTLIISAFLGLAMVATYGNYYMILSTVSGFVIVFYSSITAGIGNKIATESLKENFNLFLRLRFLNEWLISWWTVCLICLYEPFVKIWTKDLCLGFEFAIMMGIYFFLSQIQRPLLTFKDASGLWDKDKIRPYACMIVNVTCNLAFVQLWGVFGVLLATILTYCIALPWENRIVFQFLFHKGSWENLFSTLRCALITAGSAAATYCCTVWCADGIAGLAERAFACCVVPNAVLMVFNWKNKDFLYWKETIKRKLRPAVLR